MSEATLLNILEASPDAISLNRLSDLRYVAVNSVFIEATGIQVEDALSKTPEQLGIWQDKSQLDEFMRRIKADGAVKDMEVDFRGRGQQVLSTLTSAVVVVIDETPCIVSFTRDISKLKEAERKRIESESTFRKIIESSPDAIAIIEFATGRYIEGNHAFLQATGLGKEELLKATVRQLGIWKDEKTLKDSLRTLREAGVILANQWISNIAAAAEVPIFFRRCGRRWRKAVCSRYRTGRHGHPGGGKQAQGGTSGGTRCGKAKSEFLEYVSRDRPR